MNQYFFIIGKTPELSRAEIYSVLNKEGISFSALDYGPSYFTLQTSEEIDIKTLFQNLGGSIKVGQILNKIPLEKKSRLRVIEGIVTLDWLKENILLAADKRTNFGFSIYASQKNVPFRLIRSLRKSGVRLKKEMQQEGKIARFVTSRHPDLSSVIVDQNRLIEQGADICIFLMESKILIGRTLAVQDYQRYSERDYGRPVRDAKSGMIPPKLARMMVNLAGVEEGQSVLDPFCGSGTILMEALDIGYKNILGSDISKEAVDDSQKNISWYLKQFGQKKVQIKIKICDAKKLSRCYAHNSVDSIITEPYLGPPLKGNETPQQLKRVVALLEGIYIQSCQEFSHVLRDQGITVIVVPALLDRKNNIYWLDIVQKIETLGFFIQAFPEYVVSNRRGALEYSRKGQHLIREIFVFKKR